MLRRKRILAVFSVMLAVGAAATGLAIAQIGGGDSAASPETGTRGVGVPEGPFVDFCPTPEQTDLHMQIYGFDYKPTVACTREGEPVAPTPEPSPEAAQDPDEGLSAAQTCEIDKTSLQSAKPLPDRDGDPLTREGVLPDGRQIVVDVFGDPDSLKGQTLRDLADILPC